MKRALILAACLAGCTPQPGQVGDVGEPMRPVAPDMPYSIEVYVDPETGCNYFVTTGWASGISAPAPRYADATGQIYGCRQ